MGNRTKAFKRTLKRKEMNEFFNMPRMEIYQKFIEKYYSTTTKPNEMKFTTKPPSKHGIKPLYLTDLMYLSDQLPDLPYFDHRKNVIDAFGKGEWKKVDEYVDYVHRVHMELYVIKPNKSLREHILSELTNYTNRILTWFKTIV
jgi:hypothetical protein